MESQMPLKKKKGQREWRGEEIMHVLSVKSKSSNQRVKNLA